MLDKVLVPVDGSSRAEAVFGRLRLLLSGPDTEVVILRAAYVPASLRGVDHTALLEEREEEAKRCVEKLARRLRLSGIRARGIVRNRYPAGAILDTAVQEGAGMIAMTSHGATGVRNWMLGSVAQKVLQSSHVPVLLMHSYEHVFGREPVSGEVLEFSPRRILVPIDGSRHSMAVVPAVGELAHRFGAEIVCLFVKEAASRRTAVLASAAEGRARGLTVEEAHDPGADPAVAACDCFVPIRVRAVPVRATGDPALRILEVSRAEHVDLIAMSTHGGSDGVQWPLGSVTQKVLSASRLPMLVVRPYAATAS